MHNLIGEEAEDWRDILAQPDLWLHLYGKLEIAPGPQDGPCDARLPGDDLSAFRSARLDRLRRASLYRAFA